METLDNRLLMSLIEFIRTKQLDEIDPALTLKELVDIQKQIHQRLQVNLSGGLFNYGNDNPEISDHFAESSLYSYSTTKRRDDNSQPADINEAKPMKPKDLFMVTKPRKYTSKMNFSKFPDLDFEEEVEKPKQCMEVTSQHIIEIEPSYSQSDCASIDND